MKSARYAESFYELSTDRCVSSSCERARLEVNGRTGTNEHASCEH